MNLHVKSLWHKVALTDVASDLSNGLCKQCCQVVHDWGLGRRVWMHNVIELPLFYVVLCFPVIMQPITMQHWVRQHKQEALDRVWEF